MQKQATPSGRKELNLEAAARVRTAMVTALDRDFGGNKTALGKELGISQPAVTRITQGGGISRQTAERMAAYLKVSFDELAGVASASMPKARFPMLEVCLAYHHDHWPGYVEAAARAGIFPDDVTPEAWASRLNSLAVSMAGVQRKAAAVKGKKK